MDYSNIINHFSTKKITLEKFELWTDEGTSIFPFYPLCMDSAPCLQNKIETNEKYWVLNESNDEKLTNIQYTIDRSKGYGFNFYVHIHNEKKLYLICTYLTNKNIYREKKIIMTHSDYI